MLFYDQLHIISICSVLRYVLMCVQVQNVTTQRPINDNQSRSLPHILPTTNLGVPGTPLLEWNGREWIPPQQSSIAAVAASQQGE